MKKISILAIFGLILFIGICSATTVTLDKTYDLGDTYTSHDNPGSNYGDESYLHMWYAGPPYNDMGFIKFNISSIPAEATINSATIYLYFYSGDLHSHGLSFSLYNTSWDEMTMTESNIPSGSIFQSTSDPWFSSYGHYYPFSISPGNFSEALNNGLFGQSVGEIGGRLNYGDGGYEIFLRTKETTGSYPPYMVVNYDLPVDTCTYSGSGNWNINCSDNCMIDSPVVGDGSNITIIGDGHMTITRDITNFKNKFISGGSGHCTVTCINGRCLK